MNDKIERLKEACLPVITLLIKYEGPQSKAAKEFGEAVLDLGLNDNATMILRGILQNCEAAKEE